MSDSKPRVVVFGDSHFACVKHAVNAGMVDTSAVDLEFWGHVGGRFRFLEFRDRAIRPTNEETAARFAKTNESGRSFLPVTEFDHVIFVGCRISVTGQFAAVCQFLRDNAGISSALSDRILTDAFRAAPVYRFAQETAKLGVNVLLSPRSFPSLTDPLPLQDQYPAIADITAAERQVLWDHMHDVAREDGLTLIQQRDKTVASALFTDPKYATRHLTRRGDFEHKNANYGALVLRDALAHI